MKKIIETAAKATEKNIGTIGGNGFVAPPEILHRISDEDEPEKDEEEIILEWFAKMIMSPVYFKK